MNNLTKEDLIKIIKDMKEELNIYKEAIEEIKKYEPCYYEMDYDWDENPIDSYQSLDIDYIVNNIREIKKIEKEETSSIRYFGGVVDDGEFDI